MKTILTTILFLLALTGCKIDLTIIGLGAVKTDSGSIDCAAGTTGDCHQEYVTNANDCTVAGNCTVVGANGTTETFNALPSDDSSFGGWGDICFGAANLQCTHTITPDYAADPDAQLNVTATFDPDPTPQNATYLYNAQGQRSSKTVNGVTTHFVYSDVDGQLLGEYNATGSPIREYIYLEGERVAMYDYTTVEPKDSTNQKAIVYLHNNQVGQVQYAFNSDGQMIYERVQTPFGETMGEINAYNLQMPVRFPGQYYDAETGFNQNWNRDYDPTIGRYIESDPIGLNGGINTYGYVGQSPGMWIDLMGLLTGEAERIVDKYIAEGVDVQDAWLRAEHDRRLEHWKDGTVHHEAENYLYGQVLTTVDGWPTVFAHGGTVIHAGLTGMDYSPKAHKAGHEGVNDGSKAPEEGREPPDQPDYYDDGFSCREKMPPANMGSHPRPPCYWVRGHVVCSRGYGGWRDTR